MRTLSEPLRTAVACLLVLAVCVVALILKVQDVREREMLVSAGRALAAEQRADSIRVVNAKLRDSATVAKARADSALALADSLAARKPAVRLVYREAVLRSTDSALIVASTDALSQADSIEHALRVALFHTDTALTLTRVRAINAEGALGESQRALGDLRRSIDREHKARRLTALVPRVGAGVAIGANIITHQPAAVVGITFGWRF